MSAHLKDGKGQDPRMASAHLQERREVRYIVTIAIEVSGISGTGEIFHERTFTNNVSEWGCEFILPVELKVEGIIALRVARPDARESAQARQTLFQVVRVTREEGGWLVGAWKMGSENPWGTELDSFAKPDEGDLKARRERDSGRGKRFRQDNDQ